jgi:ketol-acid reductoisomerase
MYQCGQSYPRYTIIATAESGHHVSGPRHIHPRMHNAMKPVQPGVQDGSFARRWIAEGNAGGPEFKRLRAERSQAPIETVGDELRSHMTFINPQHPPVGWASAPSSQPDSEQRDSEPETAGVGA